MGFGPLRVINDDTIAPGQGFGMHPHQSMEIITVMVEGELTHQDSMGHREVLRAGEVQRMSAGRGVVHSEINQSAPPAGSCRSGWNRKPLGEIRNTSKSRLPSQRAGPACWIPAVRRRPWPFSGRCGSGAANRQPGIPWNCRCSPTGRGGCS